jgi:hypothetical protein
MAAVEQLGTLVDLIEDLGPASRRMIRGRLRNAKVAGKIRATTD